MQYHRRAHQSGTAHHVVVSVDVASARHRM